PPEEGLFSYSPNGATAILPSHDTRCRPVGTPIKKFVSGGSLRSPPAKRSSTLRVEEKKKQGNFRMA
ncbi:MAG: hypothetical protein JW849_11485, partial [Phycisphaerae bacterium]|nr:hypothetical protein [Phycisphaerae bacterium]